MQNKRNYCIEIIYRICDSVLQLQIYCYAYVMDMSINMRQFLAVLWTLGVLLHFYLLHEFFLLDYETVLSNLKLYKLSFRKYNLSKN